MVTLLVTGTLAAGGSAAINQYLERDSDALMERTRRRPLPAGDIPHSPMLLFAGVLMVLLPALGVLPFNRPLAAFLLAGAFIYTGIYTVWLKPRTPLNIVVGGAAGSAAVLSGSAAAGTWNATPALVLALIVFLWTPTHFWSLAILYREDYERGNIPMLPTQMSARAAAAWVMLHAVAASLGVVLLAAYPTVGWLYTLPTGVATLILLGQGLRLLLHPQQAQARSLFIFSNIYLGLVLLSICLDALL
jgi:protoheme IX farnesyltransferase